MAKRKYRKQKHLWASETNVTMDIYKYVNPDLLVKVDGISWIFNPRYGKKDEQEIKAEKEKAQNKDLVPLIKRQTTRYKVY